MFMDVSQPFGVGYMVEDVNGKQHRVHFPSYPFERHKTADGRVWVTAECLRVTQPSDDVIITLENGSKLRIKSSAPTLRTIPTRPDRLGL